MLSGEGMQRRKTVKNNNRSKAKATLYVQHTFFVHFARLQRETSRHFLVTRFLTHGAPL